MLTLALTAAMDRAEQQTAAVRRGTAILSHLVELQAKPETSGQPEQPPVAEVFFPDTAVMLGLW